MRFIERLVDKDWRPGRLFKLTDSMPFWPMAPMERGEPVSPVHMKPYNQEIIAMAIDVRMDEDDPFFADIIVLIGSELYLFSVSENARGIPFKPLTD